MILVCRHHASRQAVREGGESGSAGQLVQGVVSEVLELISLPYLDKSKGNHTDLEEYSHILSLETGLRVRETAEMNL